MTTTIATELRRLVQQLHDERAEHVKAIEAIDQTFQDLGFDAQQAMPVVNAQPVSTKNTAISSKKRNRKTFAVTADAFVLSFIQANPGCTTAQVNEQWIKEGRNGKADQTLFKLVKVDQIVRKNIKGRRGSTYNVK